MFYDLATLFVLLVLIPATVVSKLKPNKLGLKTFVRRSWKLVGALVVAGLFYNWVYKPHIAPRISDFWTNSARPWLVSKGLIQ